MIGEYITYWENENGSECKIKVCYDFQPYEAPVYYPNDAAHPGCPAEVTIESLWIEEDFYDVPQWNEFFDASDEDEERWCQEILESINEE